MPLAKMQVCAPQPQLHSLKQNPALSTSNLMMSDVEDGMILNGQPDSLSALMRIENGFSVSVLKKRRRLIELLRTKRP